MFRDNQDSPIPQSKINSKNVNSGISMEGRRNSKISKPGDKTVGTSRSLFNRTSSPKGRHSMQGSFFY
ncbi:unnamed protein product [Parnassius apollo]|uniref:(apollo) hypothetical protein n=1 Tax=Parnassius apollo TaxID=110799 RepID=A0A8S3YBJ9_PARAO|nr:unnamed protein product [Parnassius apollo]